MDILELLDTLAVINRDDGKRFLQTNRLDAITELLWNSSYRRINSQGLFHLYSRVPLSKINEPVIIISSHVDCEHKITDCFSEVCDTDNSLIKGTYDNLLTNASIVSLMLEGELPENVLIAFTGDEEVGSKGARKLTKYLKKNSIEIKCAIVLDVTDMGWKEAADFTVENDFWNDDIGTKVISSAENSGDNWRFVPSNVMKIPEYVDSERVFYIEAAPDESWDYNEKGICCFSFCVPTLGLMHSNEGIFAKISSVNKYIYNLKKIVLSL